VLRLLTIVLNTVCSLRASAMTAMITAIRDEHG